MAYKNNKTYFINILLFLSLFILITGVTVFEVFYEVYNNSNYKEPSLLHTQYNTHSDVIKDKNINNILFTNINCSYDDGVSLITYTITNNTNNVIHLGEYEIKLRDKNKDVLAIIAPELDFGINPGDSYDASNAINIDARDVYSLDLVLNNT